MRGMYWILALLLVLAACSQQPVSTPVQPTPAVAPVAPAPQQESVPLPTASRFDVSETRPVESLNEFVEDFLDYAAKDEREFFQFIKQHKGDVAERIANQDSIRNRLIEDLTDIIAEFPTSPYVDDARFLIGYLHFLHADARDLLYARSRTLFEQTRDNYPEGEVNQVVVTLVPELEELWILAGFPEELPMNLVVLEMLRVIEEKEENHEGVRALCNEVIDAYPELDGVQARCSFIIAESHMTEGNEVEAFNQLEALLEEFQAVTFFRNKALCQSLTYFLDNEFSEEPETARRLTELLDSFADPTTYINEVEYCTVPTNPSAEELLPIWEKKIFKVFIFDMNDHKEFLIQDAFDKWQVATNQEFRFEILSTRSPTGSDITANINNGPPEDAIDGNAKTELVVQPAPRAVNARAKLTKADILINTFLDSDEFSVEAQRQIGRALGLRRGSTQNAIMASGTSVTEVDVQTLRDLYEIPIEPLN